MASQTQRFTGIKKNRAPEGKARQPLERGRLSTPESLSEASLVSSESAGWQHPLKQMKQLHNVQQHQLAVQIGCYQGNRHLASMIQREGEDEASKSLVLGQVSSEATSENALIQNQAHTGPTETQTEAADAEMGLGVLWEMEKEKLDAVR